LYNFVKIIDEISKKSVLLEERKNIVVIVSDFYHETNTDSFYALENSLKKLSKEAGDNLIMNLIVLAGKSNNEQYNIDKTRLLINEYCKFVYYYEYEQGTLLNHENINSYMSSVVKYPQKDTLQKVVFYYPFEGNKYEEIKKTKIKFKKGGNFTLNIRNESLFPQPIFMQMTLDNNEEKSILFKSDYPIVETINNDCPYTAQIQAVDIPKNAFLEISSSSSKRKNQIPIVFRELVPKTVCYVLVLAYTLCALLLCACFLFFAMKFKACVHIKRNKRVLFVGLFILAFVPLLLPAYYLCIFYCLHNTLFSLLLIIVFIIGFITGRFLLHEKTLLDKKCLEKCKVQLCLPCHSPTTK
jgi:hypothetical protein